MCLALAGEVDAEDCISDLLIRRKADMLKAEGFVDAGYKYILIASCWQAEKRYILVYQLSITRIWVERRKKERKNEGRNATERHTQTDRAGVRHAHTDTEKKKKLGKNRICLHDASLS